MCRPLRIGMAGLALSHPYTFAQVLAASGQPPAWVWDEDLEKAAAFAAQYEAQVCPSPAAMAAQQPDGVMLCSVASDHLEHSRPFLQRGIPLFIDRPLAVSEAALDGILAAKEAGGGPLLCSSILRWAEAFAPIRSALAEGRLGEVLGASVTICHSIEAYLKPGNTWQDEPERGGGTLVTMGQHGLDLLASLLGADWRSASASTSRRRLHQSRSEDLAAVTLRWDDGRIATLHLIGASTAHGYSLTLFGSEGVMTASAPSGAPDTLRDYGYTGTVDQFLQMIRTGEPPLPLAEMEAVARTLLRLRASAGT